MCTSIFIMVSVTLLCNDQTLRQAGPTDAESDTEVKGVPELFIQSTGQYQKILHDQMEVPKTLDYTLKLGTKALSQTHGKNVQRMLKGRRWNSH